jgi:hypothetical protein
MPTDDLFSLAFESVSAGTFALAIRNDDWCEKCSVDHSAE